MPDLGGRSKLRKLLGACMQEKQVAFGVIRKFPSTCILPIILLGILVGLEFAGMRYFENRFVIARKVRTQSLAESIVSSIELEVRAAVKPVYSTAALIRRVPQYPQLMPMFVPFLTETLEKDETGTFTSSITLMPSGFINVSFPVFVGSQYDGHDVLADANREVNLRQIRNRGVEYFPVVGTNMFGIRVPVFIDGAAPNETFGFPKGPTNCSECYDPIRKQRFWGFVNALLPMDVILGPRHHQLSKLHRYSLLAPLANDFPQVVVTNTTERVKMQRFNNTDCLVVGSSPSLASSSSDILVSFNVTGDYAWWLLVEPKDDGVEALALGLLAALIFGSLVLSAMFFASLLSRRKHQLLLESLVPNSVINQARKQSGFLVGKEPILTAGSTADLILHVVSEVMAGRLPSVSDVLTLRAAILQRWDLYTPINLDKQLNQGHLDADVARALVRQLLGSVDNRTTDSAELPAKVPELDSSQASFGMFDMEMGCSLHTFDNLQEALRALVASKSFSPLRTGSCSTSFSLTPVPSCTASMTNTAVVATESPTVGYYCVQPSQSITAQPGIGVLDRMERVLAAATTSWQFDAFELAEATNGFPLSALGFYLMHQQGLINHFQLDAKKLACYLRRLETGYHKDNPYHNSTHAADVLQTMHVILCMGGLMAEGYADPLTLMAAYLSAIIHDFDHGGLTNDFLISTQDDLAWQYNDRSPLENHHIAAAWSLVKQPNFNFLPLMTKADVGALRKTVIELVLATDMKMHFSTISHFTATTSQRGTASSLSSARPPHTGPVSDAERLSVLQLALKCSDLGHTAADLLVHKRWLACLEEEFFQQGDKEAAQQLPISPLFDRSKPGASKSQVGFYNVVVLPMYSAFSTAFPATSPLLEGAQRNFQHWQGVQSTTQ